MPINKQEELSINDLLNTFESDVICELGIEPDGDNLSVKTTDEVVEALQPVLEELLIKAKQIGIEEERKRIFNETANLRISYLKGEGRPEYKLVNDTIKEIWLTLGAKQNERGDFYIEE